MAQLFFRANYVQAVGWSSTNDIETLTKAVELKPRQGTGLYGMAKRRTERMPEKPMAARRGGFLRQQRRDNEDEGQQQAKPAFNRERREIEMVIASVVRTMHKQVMVNVNHAKTQAMHNVTAVQRTLATKAPMVNADARDENAPRKPFLEIKALRSFNF